MDKIKNSIITTFKLTKNKLDAIEKKYNDTIEFEQKTIDYDPEKDMGDEFVDGLSEKNSYVRKAFLKLKFKTDIKLKIKDNVNVRIIFYHDNDLNLISKCVKRIYCILNIFANPIHMKKYDGTFFEIYLFDAPRIMTQTYEKTPEEIMEIGKKGYFNCVCGYATVFRGKFQICVTRKNGCLGLLTHELGHICELDLSVFENDKYVFPFDRLVDWKKIVKETFDISETCNIGNMNEGINNGNSSIIHAMFIALEDNQTKISLMEKYIIAYKDEFLHSINQMNYLLKWFKYNSLKDLLTPKQNKYTQKSMMLEYILVRCIYLLHFDELKVFPIDDQVNEIDDKEYLRTFYQKMLDSIETIDNLRKKTNEKTINMDYYHNS
jgi:hypothetical protein